MVSAIGTTSPDPASDPGWEPSGDGQQLSAFLRGMNSRTAWLILLANLVGMGFLLVGTLVFSHVRQGLVEARLSNLMSQAELIANVISEVATEGDPEPVMDIELAREVLRKMQTPASARTRLFDTEGSAFADSYLLADRVEQRVLPPIGPNAPLLGEHGRLKSFIKRVLRGEPIAPKNWPGIEVELRRARAGYVVQGERRNDGGYRAVSVSVPIRRVQMVLGVVTVEADDVDQLIWRERLATIPLALGALLIAAATSIFLAAQIAQPLHRLAKAANRVRTGQDQIIEESDLQGRRDELGQLARALSDMTSALTARIRDNERFAADVAHELKNPLAAMRASVETFLSVDNPEVRAKVGATLRSGIGRLDRMITDIANVGRLEADVTRIAAEPLDVVKLCADVISYYREQGELPATIDLVVETREPLWVLGREGPLAQVLRNLIDNALSFSPPDGKVSLEVSRRAAADGDVIRIAVIDEGPGIPPPRLESIFERFYTDRPGTRTGVTNSGLGLAIARQIVLAHKGTIRAENVYGLDGQGRKGAMLIVEIPAREP